MMILLSIRDLLPMRGGSFFTLKRLIRATWFPSLLCLACFVSAIVVGHMDFPLRIIPVLALLTLGMILFLDTLARFGDYLYYSTTNRVLNSLRLMTNLRKSFCSRQVSIALYGDTAKRFYYTLGYRWYHIFPDDVFCRKSVLFRREFWRTVTRGRN